MNPILAMGGTVHPNRSVNELSAEHALASSRINRGADFWSGKVQKREVTADERAEAQARIYGFASRIPF